MKAKGGRAMSEGDNSERQNGGRREKCQNLRGGGERNGRGLGRQNNIVKGIAGKMGKGLERLYEARRA